MRRIVPTLLLALSLAAPGHAATTKAFVFQTDFSTGSLSTVDVTPRVPHCDVASPHSDAVLRWYDGRLYVVNRFGGDNIQVIDPATYATLKQFSVGAGSNPHDIAFASPTRAYVSRYGSSDLWIVDPTTGAHTGTVSLAAFADADGNPEMDHMVVVGPLLFVALQRVDEAHGFVPTDSSLVAVIDTRADTLVDCDAARPGVQAIALVLQNPVTSFQFDPATSRLLLGCVGAYGALDGGIERINTVTLATAGIAATESALGGDIDDVVWVDAQKSYAIVSDAAFNTQLITWRPASGLRLATVWNPGGFSLSDAEANDRGELWVCNSSFTSPGVRVFSIATDFALGSDIVCTLPPSVLTFDAASGQISGVGPSTPGTAFSPALPSPARAGTRFTLTLAEPGRARVVAFDAAGRRVRALLDGPLAAGPSSLAWDLADESGRRVAPGLYLVRAEAGGGSWTRRVVVLDR